MLSRAASRVFSSPIYRSFHSSSALYARKNKSMSRVSIKRGVRETQDAMKDFDFSDFRDEDEDEEEPVIKTTKMKEAMKQLNDPYSMEMDKIPLAKRGAKADDFMTEEELEAFFDEDEDDDDEEFESELEKLEDEDNKKRVKEMMSPGRAMQTLQSPNEKKKQKNDVPLHKVDNPRFNPEVINHRQQRVGHMLENFIQGLIQRETDLCQGNTQVWITHASLSPDLRHAVLYWDVTTLAHEKVSKTVEKRVVRRLDGMTNWLRVRITQQLHLKYTPKLEFKRQDNVSLERRKKFDALMALQGY